MTAALNETTPFSLTKSELTGPVPKSIENPRGIAALEALLMRVMGQDSGPLEPAVQAVPLPTVSVPKSSPSPPGPKMGPKSTLT